VVEAYEYDFKLLWSSIKLATKIVWKSIGEILKVAFGDKIFYVLLGVGGLALMVMVGLHNYDYLALNVIRRRMFGPGADMPLRVDDAILLAIIADAYRNRGVIDKFDVKLIGRPLAEKNNSVMIDLYNPDLLPSAQRHAPIKAGLSVRDDG